VSDTVHRIVTERMIAALERGTVPWRKPWQAAAGRPRSMGTGAPYRGVNVFLLGLTAAEQGYSSPFWGTYRQIGDLGGQVRMGERSTLVVFWKRADVEHRDPDTGEVTLKQLPILRYYRVFNAAQADHLPERFHPAPGEHSEISEPQAALDGYLADGPKLVHVARDQADYHPATDTIRLPLRSQFRTNEDYYATAFHEAGHSTGHPTRLGRPGIAAFDHFGSDKYAREELVAQMSSSLLCAQTGIDDPETFENSASYIAGWLSALHDDTRLVVTAAAQAQRACDLINQAEREPAKDSDRHPQASPTGNEHVPAQTMAVTAGPRQANHRPSERPTVTYDRCEPAGTAARGRRTRTAGRRPGRRHCARHRRRQAPAPLAAGTNAVRRRRRDRAGAGRHTPRRLAGRGRLKKDRTS
jgi:antirestriction protein ArdC